MLLATTDFLGNTVTAAVEPLTIWGWVWRSVVLLILFAASAFAGKILLDNYTAKTWLTALVLGWAVYACSVDMYRAVGPGRDNGWYWLTGVIVLACVGSTYVVQKLTAGGMNPLPVVLSPAGGVIAAMVKDAMIENLAEIPLAVKTAFFLLLGGLILVQVLSSSNR